MRKLITLFLISILAFFLLPTASAYDRNSTTWNDPLKPSTWCQVCDAPGYPKTEALSIANRTADNLSCCSCGNFASTAVLVRSGAKARGYFVTDFREENRKLKAAGKDFPLGPNGYVWQEVPREAANQAMKNISNGKLELAGIDCVGATAGNPCTVREVRKAYEDGYFTMFLVKHVKGYDHWIATDGLTEKGVTVVDSGFEATHFPNPNIYIPNVSWIMKFKRTDGKTPKDIPTIDKASTNLAEKSGDNTIVDKGLISVADLPGMPQMSSWEKAQVEHIQYNFNLGSFDSLSLTQKQNIEEFKVAKGLESSKTTTLAFSILFRAMGILLLTYALAVLFSHMIDITYSTGLARVVTLKRFGEENPLPWKTVSLLVGSLTLIGGILVSDSLLSIVSFILSFYY